MTFEEIIKEINTMVENVNKRIDKIKLCLNNFDWIVDEEYKFNVFMQTKQELIGGAKHLESLVKYLEFMNNKNTMKVNKND